MSGNTCEWKNVPGATVILIEDPLSENLAV